MKNLEEFLSRIPNFDMKLQNILDRNMLNGKPDIDLKDRLKSKKQQNKKLKNFEKYFKNFERSIKFPPIRRNLNKIRFDSDCLNRDLLRMKLKLLDILANIKIVSIHELDSNLTSQILPGIIKTSLKHLKIINCEIDVSELKVLASQKSINIKSLTVNNCKFLDNDQNEAAQYLVKFVSNCTRSRILTWLRIIFRILKLINCLMLY